MIINFLPHIVSLLMGPRLSFIGGLIKAGIDLFGANQAAKQQNDAARFAAKEAQLQPFNVFSGTGAVQFDTPFSGFNQNFNPFGTFNPQGFFQGSQPTQPFSRQPTNLGSLTQAPNIGFGGPQINTFSGGLNQQGTPQRGVDNRQRGTGLFNPPNTGPGTISQNPQTQAGPNTPFEHGEQFLGKATGQEGFEGLLEAAVLPDPLNLFSRPRFDTSPIPFKDPRNVFTQLDPRLQGLSNNLFQSGGALLNSNVQGPRGVGAFGGLGLPQFLAAQAQADPFFDEAGRQISENPSAPFFSGLSSSPFDIAGNEFEKLEAVLQPGRDRERRALEERLLSQGRLGSTGGALSEQAQQEAFDTSSRANLANALNTGLQTQGQLFNIGSGLENLSQQRSNLLSNMGLQQGGFFSGLGGSLSNLGTNLRAQDIGLRSQDLVRRAQDIGFNQSGLQRLLAGLQIEQSPLELLRLSSALGGNATNAAGANNLFTAGQNAADTTAATFGSLGEGLGGLFDSFGRNRGTS